MPYLSVRETLRYHAQLRLPKTLPIEEKLRLVEDVILELGLKECADTIIGDDWRKGISGGEKRRVSVGCQLLLNPSIIFMDEPTTGLDAFTSFNLMKTLVNLSRRGRTVFISIHQPRSDIYKLFDSIILLAKGRAIYTGQARTEVLEYFSKIDHICPAGVNPADFLIDIASIDSRDVESEQKTQTIVNGLIESWQKCVESGISQSYWLKEAPEISKIRRDSIEQLVGSTSTEAPKKTEEVAETRIRVTDEAIQRGSGASSITQFLILTERSWKNMLRDNLFLWGSLSEVVIVGLVFGYIFFQLNTDLTGVLTRRSGLYIVVSIQTYLLLIFYIYKCCSDMKVFDREYSDHMYSVIPYMLSQFTSQLPFNILFPLIYSVFMYFMMGLRTDDLGIHFVRFAVGNILGHLVVVTFSGFCVSAARDFPTASLIANSMYTFFSFSTGFFIQLDAIPVYLRWITKISFMTYEYRLLASNEFSNNVYACSDIGVPCEGNTILASLAIGVDDYTIPIVIMFCIILFFFVAACALLIVRPPSSTVHASPVSLTVKVSSIETKESSGHADAETTKTKISVKLHKLNLRIIKTNLFAKANEPKTTEKVLLNDVSASFPFSELTVIMGGSGAGKSTLLNILTHKGIHPGYLSKIDQTGDLLFNNAVLTDLALIPTFTSYVRQSDDHLLPALTCRETLYYSARLKLPPSMSKARKEAKAEQVLLQLGLKHCADNVVGDEKTKGLSGGEKRRLSIGIQMLTDPSILVIDEPTSGLDAFTAKHIMSTLKDIAKTGRTVICSIHQPRSDIFTMFDNVVLMVRGGRIAYSGRTKNIVPYLAKQGYELPTQTNPADFILDVTSIDLRNQRVEEETSLRVTKLVGNWRENGFSKQKADAQALNVNSGKSILKRGSSVSNADLHQSNSVYPAANNDLNSANLNNATSNVNIGHTEISASATDTSNDKEGNNVNESLVINTDIQGQENAANNMLIIPSPDGLTRAKSTGSSIDKETSLSISPSGSCRSVHWSPTDMETIINNLERSGYRTTAPFSVAFPVLLSRSFVNTYRQPLIVFARVMQVAFLGIIQALYFARQSNTQVAVQNRLGVLQQTMSVMFIGLLNCVAVFPGERNILFYEYSDRVYSVASFFLAYNLVEIPVEIVSAVIYTIFTMVVVGLNLSVGNFFCMTLAVFALTNCGESIGIAFCSIVNHVGFSVSITNSVLGIFVVMSGIMSASMPIVLDRINRISPIPYFTRLVVINEFDRYTTFTCTDEETANGTCLYKNGSDVLRLLTSNSDVFQFSYSDFNLYIITGCALLIVYRIISFLILWNRAGKV